MTASSAPLVRRTPHGWLAVSEEQYPRIGVTGLTAEEAVRQWEESRQSWLRLREQPDPLVSELPE